MTAYLIGAAFILVVSFAVMLKAFASKHCIQNQERRHRIFVVAGSVFVATATAVAVLVLSMNHSRSNDDPGPPKAPDLVFDNVMDGEASE